MVAMVHGPVQVPVEATPQACQLDGGWQCASSWAKTGDDFRFTPTAKPTITPTGQQNICTTGSGVTLTAVNSGSMTSPTYQWQVYASPNTNIGGQTGTTYTANPTTPGNYYYTVQLTRRYMCQKF